MFRFHIQEVDEDNLDEASSEAATSKSEMNILNHKLEEFKKTRDLTFSKIEAEQTDLNKNSVPLTTSRSTSRLPSRPSI